MDENRKKFSFESMSNSLNEIEKTIKITKTTFSFENMSSSLNDIEENIINTEINLNITFKSLKEFINYLKYTFPDIENVNIKHKIIIYLLNYDFNKKECDDNTHKKFIFKKINELKYIHKQYSNIIKKKMNITFIRLFKIISIGYQRYKHEIFKNNKNNKRKIIIKEKL
jgi:hypothetical protein